MTEPSEPGPLKRTIPPDLQREVEDIQKKFSRTTGPPGDLDEEKKRWLIVGICLHSIISPLLRKHVDPILSNLYSSLVTSNSIDTQSCNGYLKKYPVTNKYDLSYESVNNNRRLNKNCYDYKVTSHVDLSKLFLRPYMAQYNGFNESCDSSALLNLVINISSFPPIIQTDAKKIKSDIRNPWAHCRFREWTTGKYTDSFNVMGQLVKDIGLSNIEENRILGELNTWATNAQHFLSGTTLGLDIVGEIRQQTHILSSYVQTLCSEADSQFIGFQEKLTRIEYNLQQRIQILESALFLMRTPDYLDHVKDEKEKSYLTEKNDNHRHSLNTLKTKLRTKYPKQVHDYSCTYEKKAEGKLYLSGFEEMGKRVLQHFKTMLSLQYPTDSLGLSPTLKDVLKLEHETFMFQRSQVLLGREESVQTIHRYIDDSVKEHVPLVLAGFPGSGKSALIAYTVKQCLTNKKYKVFYHFIGATPGSTDLFQILQRFFLEFMPEGTKMPDELQEMKRYAHTMFKNAAQVAKKEGYQKIVVFLDALNQMDDDGDAHYLVWLPKKLPEGMRIIVSTLEGKCLNSLRDDPDRKTDEKKSIELSVDPLFKSIRKNIVCQILAEYNKRLDDEQDNNLTEVLDWAPIQSKTASFLVDIGEYTIAEDMLNEVITTLVEKYGKDSKELCEPTYCMVNLLFKKALQYVYVAHPGYRECRIKGLKISELCVAVNKKYFSKDKQYLGRVLLSCGYFERGTSCLKEAKNMFENINDQQGLAVALYMLGEENQYHSDLSIPTEMFNKSMELCSSMFGKFHLNTARCAQLHGQMLWNNWTNNRKPEFLENCLVLYQQEVEILCEVQGDLHPNTVRSREDVIIILQKLGRDEEAKKYQDQQPKEHSAL